MADRRGPEALPRGSGAPYFSKNVKIRPKNSLNGYRSFIFLKICQESPEEFGIAIGVRGMNILALEVGPWIKPMPDLGMFVGTIMQKKLILDLPEPCRGDLRGFVIFL